MSMGSARLAAVVSCDERGGERGVIGCVIRGVERGGVARGCVMRRGVERRGVERGWIVRGVERGWEKRCGVLRDERLGCVDLAQRVRRGEMQRTFILILDAPFKDMFVEVTVMIMRAVPHPHPPPHPVKRRH